FIATRQNMLGLLNHEQTHRLGVRSRLGDHLANMTMAWPLLITLEGYRRIHLAHHRHYFTDQDPDFRRKQGPEWTYPKRVMQFLTTVVVDVTGFNIVRFVAGKRGREAKSGPPKPITPPWARLVFYGAAAVTFTWTETWIPFLVYWVLPWATVLQLIVRWGAVCEHKYNLVSPSVEQSTPIIEPGRLESLLLPNLNFNLHIYHHWYPAIPFTKLPRVHEIFRREGLVRDENVFHGYISYLMYLLGRRPELS
ncbi:MAG: fatty acid desaturase, partial [Phycisphaeraceae bacterium]|nr:fatty acid desaturase [Phycisphaeraceae bacterium]